GWSVRNATRVIGQSDVRNLHFSAPGIKAGTVNLGYFARMTNDFPPIAQPNGPSATQANFGLRWTADLMSSSPRRGSSDVRIRPESLRLASRGRQMSFAGIIDYTENARSMALCYVVHYAPGVRANAMLRVPAADL